MGTDWQQFIKDLAAKTKLIEVALELRMQGIQPRKGRSTKVLCPFHDDHTPSLELYDSHYHCFACNAHGNVYELIKTLQGLNFFGAVKWLAAFKGMQLPQTTTYIGKQYKPRERGLVLAFECYKNQTTKELSRLKQWASSRGFAPSFLKSTEVFSVKGNKLSVKYNPEEDIEEIDSLDEAGLIFKLKTPLELGSIYHDIFYTDRIVFTMRNSDGKIAGFTGRTLGDEKPKYLFSKGLPKGQLLYRFNIVREILYKSSKPKKTETVHVYVVEGLLDALRLESLNFSAVAILGSRITNKQAELIGNFAGELEQQNRNLAVHLFLDSDEAGKHGTAASIPVLWREAQINHFTLDVIFPKGNKDKIAHDPDEFLRDYKIEKVPVFLQDSAVSCLRFIVAHQLDCLPGEIEEIWKTIPQTEILSCLRNINKLGDSIFWNEIFARHFPLSVSFGKENKEETECFRLLEDFLRASQETRLTKPNKTITSSVSAKEQFQHALKLATWSTQRKDISVDEGAWARINMAGDIFFEHFRQMLNQGVSHEEPFTAAKVPKRLGEYRLKAIPCHEDLVLQQYMMNSLLSNYIQSPQFSNYIPGVRFSRSDRSKRVWTTGDKNQIPVTPENDENIASFAYQLDMDVIEGREPPSSSGMFRHYSECWQHFISFIDKKIGQFTSKNLYVVRLDIRRYYDQLPLFTVRDALFQGLKKALNTLDNPKQCAPAFRPLDNDPNERAKLLVDWLCSQSFGYKYYDPNNGEIKQYEWKDRGVPQGPDLSAYLANIALFTLDHIVTEYIDKLNKDANGEDSPLHALYARYVDDLILITDSPAYLSTLRILIENELAKIGLELNKKTIPLPAMTKDEGRQWLTDSRGGLGVSSPAYMPTMDFETLVNDCIDCGHIDRRDSLNILHNTHMSNPYTALDDIIAGIKAARNNRELRFGDLCVAAKHLWRVVVEKSGNNESLDDMVKIFYKLWKDTEQQGYVVNESDQTYYDVTAILVALDGLKRFLESRTDRNPVFSSEAHEKNNKLRKQLAQAVIANNLDCLNTLPGKRDSEFVKEQEIEFMVKLKQLSLLNDACLVLKEQKTGPFPIAFDPRGWEKLPPPLMSHCFSIDMSCHGSILLDYAQFIPPNKILSPVLYLHNAITRLYSQFNTLADNNRVIDPLSGLINPFNQLLSDPIAKQPYLKRTIDMIKLWLPAEHKDRKIDFDDTVLDITLRSFINVTSKNFISTYLVKRPEFIHALLDGAEPFPVPPGVNYPGIFGWNKNKKQFVRVDFEEHALINEPDGIFWKPFAQNGNKGGKKYFRFYADSNGWYPLSAVILNEKKIIDHNSSPAFCAYLFLGLYNIQHTVEQNIVPCAVPYIIVKDFQQETLSFSMVDLIGYRVSKDYFATTAFIRKGSALIGEGIPEKYSDVWRIGTTIADLTHLIDYSHADSSLRLTKKPFIYERDDSAGWARETLLRFAFYRLRGNTIRPGKLKLDPIFNLPMPAARAVKHLKDFPDKSETIPIAELQLKYIISSSAESRAMAFRMQYDVINTGPGSASYILVAFASHYFRGDEILAERLPKPPIIDNTLLPSRRAVLGYYELTRRIGTLLTDETIEDNIGVWNGIDTLVAGLRILAVTENIKAQVKERLHLLQEKDFSQLLPGEEKIPVVDSTGLESFGIDSQTVFFFNNGLNGYSELIKQILTLKLNPSSVTIAVDNITPIGWWSLLLIFCGFSTHPFAKSAAFVKMTNAGSLEKLCNDCVKISKALLLWDEASLDFPWEGLLSTCRQWTGAFTQDVFKTLTELDTLLDFTIVTKIDSLFSYYPNSRKGTIEFTLPSERRTLPSWRFHFATIAGAGREIETEQEGDKKISFWSETRKDGKLITISAMSNSLASLAGIKKIHEQLVTEETDTLNITQEVIKPDIKKAKGSQKDALKNDKLKKEPKNGEKDNKRNLSASDWKRIYKWQVDSWGDRNEETRNVAKHVRVALLQMEVDSTYFHPIVELCIQSQDESNTISTDTIKEVQKDITKWDTNKASLMINQTRSCIEFRRQKILKKVLEACKIFKVDILVLSEYSIRPETLEWIAKNLAELAPKTSVWAGTFRKPPYIPDNSFDFLKEVPDWAAPIPVVFPPGSQSEQAKIEVKRWKKYPASGLGEIINPFMAEIQPIVWMLRNINGFSDHRDLVCELVCSEIFLLTSPSNLISLAGRLRALVHKFGLPGEESPRRVMEKVVSPDCDSFSLFTSLQTPRNYRQHPIVIVPALTNRPVDWAVAGQAGYLAAGLTTVFCNGVHRLGRGQSCFIGTDCWDDDNKKSDLSRHFPQLGPYHGVNPGIYNLTQNDRGWLAQKEQALVIADIAPIHSFGGKPSPESIGSSLSLVAHLPIFESNYLGPPVQEGGCRCMRKHKDIKNEFENIIKNIYNRLIKVENQSSSSNEGRTSIKDYNPEILKKSLKDLAKLISKHKPSHWLNKRAEAYEKHHAGDPAPWPPPVALDWLFVDINYHDPNDPIPIICIPEYRKAPGETE